MSDIKETTYQNFMPEWKLIVRDAVYNVDNDTADMADETIVAIDEYIHWLESELYEDPDYDYYDPIDSP